jgi:hypothetical protein
MHMHINTEDRIYVSLYKRNPGTSLVEMKLPVSYWKEMEEEIAQAVH